MNKPELLIPAGSLEVLYTAVNYGADAVYIGGDIFSLRAKAKNFSKEDIESSDEIKYTPINNSLLDFYVEDGEVIHDYK